MTLSKTKGGNMKNKTLAFLVVVALLALPAVALAAKAEPAGSADISFTLGGYIKLHTFWDSASMNKNLTTPPLRNNNVEGQHGRFNATAQSSRFSFTIKGPDLWGAKTSGMIEMDFDAAGDARQNSGNSFAPRMRLAFFRFNWPGTELIMGQYWGLFSDFQLETIQDAGMQFHGFPATNRFGQVRLTQSFGLGWAKNDKLSLAVVVGKPTDSADAAAVLGNAYAPATTTTLSGQTSETPQFQGSITYEGDLWGKAAFYGRPRPFTAQVVGGWQRSRYQKARIDLLAGTIDQKYLNNWCIQGSLFLPIIPTATPNLAGTMAVSVTGYVGEGLEFLGNHTGQNVFFSRVGLLALEANLQRVWGGSVQANYYFNNQWFIAAAVGLGNNFGVNGFDAGLNNSNTGLVHNWWEADLTLYYRPITAFKFGLGYAYNRAEYYRSTTVQSNTTNFGEAHRVQFAGWFFF